MDSVLRLQQFGPQMSDGHLLLLKGGEVLLGVWGSDAMVVPTQVVGSQAGSPAEHRMESDKDQVSLFTFHTETFWNVEVETPHCGRHFVWPSWNYRLPRYYWPVAKMLV